MDRTHISGLSELGIYNGIYPDKDFKLKREDGLEIGASVYGTKDEGVKPGIILLHGNTPLGRKLPFYEVLSTKLAERGYIVITIDFAGFGESGDPFQFNTIEALDSTKEVFAALTYLKSLRNLEEGNISIIGHSGGAEAAIPFGINEDDIKSIVAIGPPRRVRERRTSLEDREYFWERAKKTRKTLYNKDFPEWYTIDLWQKLSYGREMDSYIDYFSQKGHKPIFLIDGELETEKDRTYLKNYHLKIKEPKRYSTIKNSDHYGNTFMRKGIIFYNKKVIDDLASVIDSWLRKNSE